MIHNIIPEMEYKLYPNPVSGLLNISWNSKLDTPERIKIISVNGEVILSLDRTEILSNSIRIELFNTRPGIYFTEIIQPGCKPVVKKFIVLDSILF